MLSFVNALWRDRIGPDGDFAFLELVEEMRQMAAERNPSP
jgi:hypothetical protein